LHWVKDVVLKEDASTIKTGNAPQNISTIKNIVINILRTNIDESITKAIRLVANKIEKLIKLII
jgi:predicted transposase YbfD/YdcC